MGSREVGGEEKPLYYKFQLRLEVRPDTDRLLPSAVGVTLSTGVTVTLVAPDDLMASTKPLRHELAILE